MGCDIHIFAEVKHETDYASGEFEWREANALFRDPWGHLSVEPWSGRNYRFFGELADVRNYEEAAPKFAHRGIPDDSPLKLHLEDRDYHSHSYATLEELERASWSEDIEGYAWTLIDNLRKLGPSDRVRAVFAFDN